MDNVAFGIVTCDQYIPTRCRAILDTWGRGIENQIYFFGDEENVEGLFNQLDCINPVDNFPGRTGRPYEDAAHKLFNGIRKIYTAAPDADWYCFSDDDTYVKLDRLLWYTNQIDKEAIAVYGYDKAQMYEADRTLHYPSGGAGFLMNRATLHKVVEFLDTGEISTPERWSDVMIGFALRNAEIPIVDHTVFFDFTPEEEWMEWQWSGGRVYTHPHITYHRMTPKLMYEFYDAYVIKAAKILRLWQKPSFDEVLAQHGPVKLCSEMLRKEKEE
jgi:hypothetical protein